MALPHGPRHHRAGPVTRLGRLGWVTYGATLGLTTGIALTITAPRWAGHITKATHRGKK